MSIQDCSHAVLRQKTGLRPVFLCALASTHPLGALFDLIASDRHSNVFCLKRNLVDPHFTPVGSCSSLLFLSHCPAPKRSRFGWKCSSRDLRIWPRADLETRACFRPEDAGGRMHQINAPGNSPSHGKRVIWHKKIKLFIIYEIHVVRQEGLPRPALPDLPCLTGLSGGVTAAGTA